MKSTITSCLVRYKPHMQDTSYCQERQHIYSCVERTCNSCSLHRCTLLISKLSDFCYIQHVWNHDHHGFYSSTAEYTHILQPTWITTARIQVSSMFTGILFISGFCKWSQKFQFQHKSKGRKRCALVALYQSYNAWTILETKFLMLL